MITELELHRIYLNKLYIGCPNDSVSYLFYEKVTRDNQGQMTTKYIKAYDVREKGNLINNFNSNAPLQKEEMKDLMPFKTYVQQYNLDITLFNAEAQYRNILLENEIEAITKSIRYQCSIDINTYNSLLNQATVVSKYIADLLGLNVYSVENNVQKPQGLEEVLVTAKEMKIFLDTLKKYIFNSILYSRAIYQRNSLQSHVDPENYPHSFLVVNKDALVKRSLKVAHIEEVPHLLNNTFRIRIDHNGQITLLESRRMENSSLSQKVYKIG